MFVTNYTSCLRQSRVHKIFCFPRCQPISVNCYIAETKRDWLIHGHVALDKCNVSLGQQVNNCCPLRPAPYLNKQNGGETRKFINSDFRAFCLKKYTNRQRGYASETKI